MERPALNSIRGQSLPELIFSALWCLGVWLAWGFLSLEERLEERLGGLEGPGRLKWAQQWWLGALEWVRCAVGRLAGGGSCAR